MPADIGLKKWTPDDLETLVKYANNTKIADNLTDAFPSPYTMEDGRAYIEGAMNDSPTKFFAVTYGGEIVGSIGVFPQSDVHRKNAAVAYWIAEPFWGRGIATEAIRLVVEYGFSAFDIVRIYAKPFGMNTGSHRALEKAGFTLEARLKNVIFKNGQLTDELTYGIRRQ